jgi:hypothetical protein
MVLIPCPTAVPGRSRWVGRSKRMMRETCPLSRGIGNMSQSSRTNAAPLAKRWAQEAMGRRPFGGGSFPAAEIHGPGVQVNAAVESVLSLVESHQGLRSKRLLDFPFKVSLCQEAMMSIQPVQPTGPACLLWVG